MRVSDILEHYWIIGFILLTTGTCIAWLVYGLMSVGNRGIIYLFVVFFNILAIVSYKKSWKLLFAFSLSPFNY